MLRGTSSGAVAPHVRSAGRGRAAAVICAILLVGMFVAGCATSYSSGYRERQPTYRPPQTARNQLQIEARPLTSRTEPLFGNETHKALRRAEQHYRAIVAAGGWPEISGAYGRNLRPEDGTSRLPDLERRLALGGDLAKGGGGIYGPVSGDISDALTRFQLRHGLRPSGMLDDQTLKALNVPADQRLAQIRTNLDRIRQGLPAMKRFARYVIVNIPSFELEAVEGQRVVRRHRVIVGRPDRPTPVVDAAIQNLNVLPYWHVPESIVRHDLVPRVRSNPDYLHKHRIRILREWQGREIPPETINWRSPAVTRLKFRQDPGPWNALGVIRLDMPNKHAVYMHDTPMKSLFRQPQRAFSAGCVRVQNALDLAAWVLRDDSGGDLARMKGSIESGVQTDIPVPSPVPVRFVYVTAWADPDGRVSFRPDLYGLDRPIGLAARSVRRLALRNGSISP